MDYVVEAVVGHSHLSLHLLSDTGTQTGMLEREANLTVGRAIRSGMADLPGGYSGEVLVGIVPCQLQGLQHLTEFLIIPHVDVITNNGQAPAHLVAGAAGRQPKRVSQEPGWRQALASPWIQGGNWG